MSSIDCHPLLSKLGYPAKKQMVVKDPNHTEWVLQRMRKGGFDKLQVVVDFDYTLTRVHDPDGNKFHCSWGVLDNSPLMPDFYKVETQKLLDKYYPIEVCHIMTEEEKIPHMVQWYNSVYDLIAKCSLNRDDIKTSVAYSNIQLRLRSEELMRVLEKQGVPVLVFSAGMGDILINVLERFNILTCNVKVVSNFFKYDDKDKIIGFDGDLIHMFNKNENAFHSSPYFGEISCRHNVLLMGDSLGDVKMTVGIPDPNAVLKIGFLNDKIDERLPAYKEAYDIVLLDDQSMDVAVDVVGLMSCS